MLKNELRTTALLQASEKRPLEEVPVGKPGFGRIFWISSQLTRLLIGVAGDRLSGRRRPELRAARVREFLEGLGGMWIKLGQVLAMRTDLFSWEFCRELAKLQDRAMKFSPQLSREIIEQQLGASVDELFDDFEVEPFAAASLSQAHKARRKNKEDWIVIKVQRPFVKEYFQYDFKWLSLAFGILGSFRALRHYQLNEMLQELELMMDEEMDYRHEASNLLQLKKNLADRNIYIPAVYPKLSTDRVLLMEYIDGVFMSDLNRVLKEDPERAEAWLAENNIAPPKVARHLFQSTLQQLFEDHLFHGDLHLGNIILLRDNNFALIDFGNVGRLDPKFASQYGQYFRAMAVGALDRAADLLLLMVDRLPPVDMVKLKRQLVRVLNRQAVRSNIRDLPYHQKSIASSSAELGQALSKFKIDVNWQYLRMSRTFETLDQNINVLYPQFDFVVEMEQYIRAKAERSKCQHLRKPLEILGRMSDLYETLEPSLTRKAFQIQEEISLAARLVALLSRTASLALGLAAVLSVWICLYQQHDWIAVNFQPAGGSFTRWMSSIPYLHQYVWWILAAVLVVAMIRAARFASSVLEHSVRLRGE